MYHIDIKKQIQIFKNKIRKKKVNFRYKIVFLNNFKKVVKLANNNRNIMLKVNFTIEVVSIN